MSRARDLADLGGSADAGTVTGKSLIINGDMAVAQRGTSETGVTSSKYANAPDRFKAGMYDCGTWTASQSTTSPDGFSNSYKLACTADKATLGTGSNVQLIQRFEGQNLQHLQKGTSGAKSITISFYVRTNKTGTYTLELFDRDNTRVFSKTYSVSSADTWEYKSVTFDGDTTGAFDNDNAVSLDVNWWLAAGTDYTTGTFSTGWSARTDANRASPSQVNIADSTSNTWHITGVKLEVGTTATPFQHESYADNLRKCQRYYQIISDQANGNGVMFAGRSVGTTSVKYAVPVTVPLRASPIGLADDPVLYAYSGGARVGSSSSTTVVQSFSIYSSFVTLSSSTFSVTDDRIYNIGALDANDTIILDSEL
jgi:hypothetical protein